MKCSLAERTQAGQPFGNASGAEILRGPLCRLEEKAAHVNAMIGYIKAKLAWMEGGSKGPEPNFTDYERASRVVGLRAGARPMGRAGKVYANRSLAL